MKVRLRRSHIKGELSAMSSKSDVHRALICAAFSDDECLIRTNCISDDMAATMGCLNAVGADISYDEAEGGFLVRPLRGPVREGLIEADCGESGSTLRFLIPVFSAIAANVRFLGRGKLPERPVSVILSELRRHGAKVEGDKLPFTIAGRASSGEYELPGDVSSQFISGLLLSFPLMEGNSFLRLSTELQSAPYVDMTMDTMSRFGVRIKRKDRSFSYERGQALSKSSGPDVSENMEASIEALGAAPDEESLKLRTKGTGVFSGGYKSPGIYEADGDWSNAAFFLAANAVYGAEEIMLRGLRQDSIQGDKAIASILSELEGGGDVTMDASEVPDLVPIVACTMALFPGEHRIINAGRLRIKESDRLRAISEGLTGLGASVTELPEGLIINGRNELKGGATVSSFNDHRIAMALSIAALFCREEVLIDGAEAVNKSFPAFFTELKRLGADLEVIEA